MSTTLAQDFLFRRIKEKLPQNSSLVDAVAEILNLSNDSAYRRIRGETPLVLQEATELCDHYGLSLDQLLRTKIGTVSFQHTRINPETYQYRQYLAELIGKVKYIGSHSEKEVIYLTKDVPLFHNFHYQPLIAFRYFFWMKTLIRHPDFVNRSFQLDSVPPDIVKLSRELIQEYNKIPSTEIWNTECINAVITQIEFYRESGCFSSASDVRNVYESLEETIRHMKQQVEFGCKFMPGENPPVKKDNFRFFYNRVVLGDNTILVITEKTKSVFLNYDMLNYMSTRDENFVEPCYQNLQNLMKRSTLISQTGEKQRNIFFNILLSKVNSRKLNL